MFRGSLLTELLPSNRHVIPIRLVRIYLHLIGFWFRAAGGCYRLVFLPNIFPGALLLRNLFRAHSPKGLVIPPGFIPVIPLAYGETHLVDRFALFLLSFTMRQHVARPRTTLSAWDHWRF